MDWITMLRSAWTSINAFNCHLQWIRPKHNNLLFICAIDAVRPFPMCSARASKRCKKNCNNMQLAFRVRAPSTHHVRSTRATATSTSTCTRCTTGHLMLCVQHRHRYRKKCQYKLKSINLEVNLVLWARNMVNRKRSRCPCLCAQRTYTVRWVLVNGCHHCHSLSSIDNAYSPPKRFINSFLSIFGQFFTNLSLSRSTRTNRHRHRCRRPSQATALQYVPVSSSFYHYLYN